MKRRRTVGSSTWEVESEQEEHSLSLSQNSSPSQSDHEQTPVMKAACPAKGSSEFHFFKQSNQIRGNKSPGLSASNSRQEFRKCVRRTPPGMHCEPKQMPPEIWPVRNLVNANSFVPEQLIHERVMLQGFPILCFFNADWCGSLWQNRWSLRLGLPCDSNC